MSYQTTITPLTPEQIAEREARVIELEMALEDLDAELAAHRAEHKDNSAPLKDEKRHLMREIRDARIAMADATPSNLAPFVGR